MTLSDPQPRFQCHSVIFTPIDVLNMCAQLTRHLFATGKFFFDVPCKSRVRWVRQVPAFILPLCQTSTVGGRRRACWSVLMPLISSRLLKHRTTRSSNARFVCRAELFCSRCQTRVFLILSRKRRFQLLCRRRNQQPQVSTTSTWNAWRTWAQKLAPGCPNSSPESWLPIPSRRSGESPSW